MRSAWMLGAACLLALPTPARANPFDLFGMGARAQALAGAQTANPEAAAAAHYNPAAVASAERAQVLAGYSYQHFALDLDGASAGLLDAHGSTLGLAVPIRRGGVTIAFGLGLYLPDPFVARIQIIPASEPHFVLLDNHPHRIVVNPVLAVKPLPWLALGAGASLLADAKGGVVFGVGVRAGEQVGEAAIDVSLPIRATPVAGVLIQPMSGLSIGASARGPIDLRLGLDILANVDAAAVSGDALIRVHSINYYTPAKLALGAAYDITRNLTLSGELAWNAWSRFKGGIADVRVLVELGITPPLVDVAFPPDEMLDTISGRAGLEWRRELAGGCQELRLRAGYAFEPTPVPLQRGLASLADNDRHVLAAGAGLEVGGGGLVRGPVRLDLALQWHHLASRTTLKDPALFPGKSMRSSGDIFGTTVSAGVSF